MAITSRATLETAIDNWLARTDISASRKEEFITLFEAVVNRRLHVRQMESSDDLTTSAGIIALPTDFGSVRTVTYNGSPAVQLAYLTPSLFRSLHPDASAGTPTTYTIEGSNLKVLPYADDTDAITLRYYAKLDALDADDATNWLLTAYPDCYLAGVMHEAQVYSQNAEGAILWKQKRDELFEEIIRESNRSMGPLAIRPIGTVI